jgi:phage shock protein PspC (stress-responsive transcriptional regulator)
MLIGLSALAAAAGLHPPSTGWHRDAIRIPMMVLAVGGSIVNLYIIWRIRSLRSRPSSQWRAQAVSAKQMRAEKFQIAVAVLSLILVVAEYASHLIARLDLPFLRGG